MQRGRRLWLLAVALLAAPVLLAGASWMLWDHVYDFDGCDGPDDYYLGSCAPPFAGADVAAGLVTMTAHASANTRGGISLEYRYTNHTGEWRSVDSSKVTVRAAGDHRVECVWDDSAVMLSSDPGTTSTRWCGDVPEDQHGSYRLLYDGATVDTIELP